MQLCGMGMSLPLSGAAVLCSEPATAGEGLCDLPRQWVLVKGFCLPCTQVETRTQAYCFTPDSEWSGINQNGDGMHVFLALVFSALLIYLLVQFARQEEIQDEYEDAILDIEARLEWARTRSRFPFGMQAQMEISHDLLGQAKNLWSQNRWRQAYQTALQSQDAMNRAQRLYSSAIAVR